MSACVVMLIGMLEDSSDGDEDHALILDNGEPPLGTASAA